MGCVAVADSGESFPSGLFLLWRQRDRPSADLPRMIRGRAVSMELGANCRNACKYFCGTLLNPGVTEGF